MSPDDNCYACSGTPSDNLPPREQIVRTRHWRVAHAFGTSVLGWLVVLPTRHITALSELEPDEAAELGPLLSGVSLILRDVVGCVKTYALLLAEAEGFSHLHFHVVPRMPDQPDNLRGPRIFSALGLSPEQSLSNDEMDDVSRSLASAWRQLCGR